MDDRQLLARAVCDAVFTSLLNAEREPEREEYWRRHADKLEQKFINQHGRHPFHFIGATTRA